MSNDIRRFRGCRRGASLRPAALAGLAVLCAAGGEAATYYVRTNGGSAAQCTGLVDAAYPGSGAGQPCAWNHPFQALPPGGTPRIAGGDTLYIRPGSYRMGFGAPGAGSCDAAGAFDCTMLPVPSGPSAAVRTRILGGDGTTGCANPPELWGAERPWQVVSLDGSSHVELACLEITDHSGCIEFHNADALPCPGGGCDVPCERDTPPYGDWASIGLFAADSTDVRLADLSIHGLAAGGVRAGRLTDWTVERVRIVANGAVGWDGDLGGPSGNAGDLLFRHLEVAWNGCAETWPGESVDLRTCWAQQAGGYGDGIGLADSAGHWLFEDSQVHHNTSDGIDLLYLVPPSSLEVRRVIAEGNAGNQLKAAGPATIVNTLLVGNCAYFSGLSPLMIGGDHCRAYGAALELALFHGDDIALVAATLAGQGDCLIGIGCRNSSCDGSESVTVQGTLFSGDVDWAQNWENTCLAYVDPPESPIPYPTYGNSLFWQVKGNPCPGSGAICGQDPRLVNPSLAAFDAHLQATSPAIDAGPVAGAPPDDLWGNLRCGTPDIGAAEYPGCFADGFESGGTNAWSAHYP